MKQTILCIFFLFVSIFTVIGQDGKVLNLTIHASSLEKNLLNDSPYLSVGVYLPPDYDIQSPVRYPVVYWLHGYSGNGKKIGNAGWSENMVKAVNNLITSGQVKPMIIVMPDGTNSFGGSMYTNSLVTGNWEDFIVQELPKFIDEHYKTIPKPESRGIAGHSMGGYGAIKIAMKHPNIFSSVYGISSAFMSYQPSVFGQQSIEKALTMKNWEEFANAGFQTKVILGVSAAFSPNPANPPFYGDLPFTLTGESTTGSEITNSKWMANIPSWMADQYISNLRQLRAITFLAGTEEMQLKNQNKYFSETLTRIKVKHSFELFDGGHNDKINEHIQTKILPFFSDILINEN